MKFYRQKQNFGYTRIRRDSVNSSDLLAHFLAERSPENEQRAAEQVGGSATAKAPLGGRRRFWIFDGGLNKVDEGYGGRRC